MNRARGDAHEALPYSADGRHAQDRAWADDTCAARVRSALKSRYRKARVPVSRQQQTQAVQQIASLFGSVKWNRNRRQRYAVRVALAVALWIS
jgi:hypothetical protein